MNTTIDTRHANVASFVLTFCVEYKIDARLVHCGDGLIVVHCQINNSHLVTRLQDHLTMSTFPSSAWNMETTAAA